MPMIMKIRFFFECLISALCNGLERLYGAAKEWNRNVDISVSAALELARGPMALMETFQGWLQS